MTAHTHPIRMDWGNRHAAQRQSKQNQDRIKPGRFNIIYADPPWRFKQWEMADSPEPGEQWARRNGASPYDVLDQAALGALDVPAIAAPDSVLLLWATYPKLAEALDVIAAWNFVYKTVAFTWVKQNRSGIGFHMGQGFHSRQNPEICLLATRGEGLRRVDASVPNLVIEPRREHSRKPNEEITARIERLYGDVPRIELFARQRTEGWSAWGNEVPGGSDITLGLTRSQGIATDAALTSVPLCLTCDQPAVTLVQLCERCANAIEDLWPEERRELGLEDEIP